MLESARMMLNSHIGMAMAQERRRDLLAAASTQARVADQRRKRLQRRQRPRREQASQLRLRFALMRRAIQTRS